MGNNIKIGILDDAFPMLRTGFRIGEFNWLIENTENTEVFTTFKDFTGLINEYKVFYPQNINKIHPIQDILGNKDRINDFNVFYTVFPHNALYFLPFFDMAKKPFVFTLYPTELIGLGSKKTEDELNRIFSNQYFTKVIVTQKMWYDYLLENNMVPKEKIEFIYGGVSNVPIYNGDKKIYKSTKNTFDICFTAHKYAGGIYTKGYDTFIGVCKELAKIDDDIRFHVVGGFGPKDINVEELGTKITFYGNRTIDFLPKFYSSIDIIISPTKSSPSVGGTTIDGFPTISCVDAALNRVVVFTADGLNNNIYFKDGEDICIIDQDINNIVKRVLYYKNNPDELERLSVNTQKKFIEIFSIESQLQKRFSLFNNIVNPS